MPSAARFPDRRSCILYREFPEAFAGGDRCETGAALTDYAARDFREHCRTNPEKIVDFH